MPSTVLDVAVNKTVTNPTLIGAFLGAGASNKLSWGQEQVKQHCIWTVNAKENKQSGGRNIGRVSLGAGVNISAEWPENTSETSMQVNS